jgi:nitroimidazol reductase NimA-like FMN-containing flavoprotein (pyridoxamine 5'-phosphate oxidase superfamily)
MGDPVGVDPPTEFDHFLQELSEDECLFLLRSRDLGRIAFNVRGNPEILPVNYALEGKIVVFRTAPGKKLEFVPGAEVAFEVDNWDLQAGLGWSVVVKGRAEEVTVDGGRTAEHIRRARVHPVAPGDRRHWIAIRGAAITGRRFHVRPAQRSRL